MLSSEAQSPISIIASGGEKAPKAFEDLLQLILVNTILADNEKVRCVENVRSVTESKKWVIESRKIGKPFKLRDGRYLYLYYYLDLSASKKLSVIKSTIQYQSSPVEPFGEIFRYDYERPSTDQNTSYEQRKNRLPDSHFHIYADLHDKTVPLYKVTLDRQHFACGRVSVESIIRMLIRDFMIKPKAEDSGWLNLLDSTEKAFRHGYDSAIVHKLIP